jgi:hypothetical protein
VAGRRPSDDESRALVNRILASKEFQRSARLRDFLTYIVDQKLTGGGQDATEVAIAQRVFHRSSTFNPAEDSIVRTEAWNLRQRLARYFAGEGAAETVTIEIPKGSYVPVFQMRSGAAPEPSSPPAGGFFPRRALLIACAGLPAGIAAWWLGANRFKKPSGAASASTDPLPGAVRLEASDPRLVQGFERARRRALGYAYTGDPVGDWYDSTAGRRYAFCMRDASHQCAGAAVLGLAGYTRNMFTRLAASVRASRDWCGFWEINKDGFPAPVDYRSDQVFWYCLPANFDLMRSAYGQYLWTGDEVYTGAVFSNFYDATMTTYISAWDRDGDGIMESAPEAGNRGVPSYWQDQPRPLVGGDMLAAQYAGYLVYDRIQRRRGGAGSLSHRLAEDSRNKAQALRTRFNTEWWNRAANRYHSALLANHTYYDTDSADTNTYALLFGITEDGAKTEAALDLMERNRKVSEQDLSYDPEILFHYGRNDAAYRALLGLMDPAFRGAEMPEVVYASVGAVAAGMFGLAPNAPAGVLETTARLPKDVAWARLAHVPVMRNVVTIRHEGTAASTLQNERGPAFRWKACFPVPPGAPAHQILVDGVAVAVGVEPRANGQMVASSMILVQPGQTRSVRYSIPKL